MELINIERYKLPIFANNVVLKFANKGKRNGYYGT